MSGSKKEDPGREIRCLKEVGEERNRTNVTERGKGNTEGPRATSDRGETRKRGRGRSLNKPCVEMS